MNVSFKVTGVKSPEISTEIIEPTSVLARHVLVDEQIGISMSI